MARLSGCLKTPDDPAMAESLSDASSSLEILETCDEGKKKSKFKAFKKFFGKKKKKGPEGPQGERRLKPGMSISSTNISSLKPVEADQQPEPRIKGSMGNKSLSHDSIFMLEPESERSTSKTCHSPEPQRGRTLQRSRGFGSLPRAESVYGAFSESMLGVVPHYVTRSGIWVAGSKIIEIPPLRPRQPSITPPLIQSNTISKDFEEISIDDESPKIPRKKAFSQKTLTLKKSAFESSPGPVHSQSLNTFEMLSSSSSTQLPIGFRTPATTQGCLDSSVAQHKRVLNPRKQKKNLQMTVKPKQDKPSFPLTSEEKSATRPKEADQKKPPKDSAGASSQEQSNKTEIYAKTTDQAANTDAAGGQGYYLRSQAHGRRHRKKESSALGKSECGPRGRSSKQSSHELGLGDRADSPPTYKTVRDSSFWRLSLEKQVMEQPIAPQAKTSTPRELFSDENKMGKRKAGFDFEARKASASHLIPENTKESMVSGSSPYHEDGASGDRKTEAKPSLLSEMGIPSTTQEDVMLSEAVRAQVFIDSFDAQLEEEDASRFDSQSLPFKMDSAKGIPTIRKKRPSENVLQPFMASVSGMASALADGGISADRLPPRSLSWSLGKPGDEEVFPDSEHVSEESNGSEQELSPIHSFQSLGELEGNQEVPTDSESFLGALSSSLEQVTPLYSSQALGEIEDEVSTESNSYVGKCNNAEGWSSSEEDLPPRHSSSALEKPTDQQEVSSISMNTVEEWGISVEQSPSRYPSQPLVRPFDQQEVSSGSVNASEEWEVMPSRYIFQPWVSPESNQRASVGPKSTTFDWVISMEPLPPRMTSKRQRRYKVGQPASSGPEIATVEGFTSMELQPPRHHSQPLVKPTAEQEISAGPESAVAEGSISVDPPPSRHPFQPQRSSKVKQNVSFRESTAVEGNISMEPLSPKVFVQSFMNPKVEQNVFSGSECAKKVILVEPLLPKYSPQSLTNPQAQHIFSENAAGDEDMFGELLPPKCRHQPLARVKFQPQTIIYDSASAPAEWSSPVEPMPPRYAFKPRVSPRFKQQASADPESTAVEWGISMEPIPPKMPSQPLKKPVAEQEVSSGSMSAPAERSGPVEPMPSQLLIKPVVKQPISADPESGVTEVDTSTEMLPPSHGSIVRHKVQQMLSRFESAAVDRDITGRPLPPKYPTHSLMRPDVQEISSCLENTVVEGGMCKKSQLPRQPSQSFVKFMAQHIFSESPIEGQIYADPLSSNQPSKSLWRPKVEHQVFSDGESADVEGSISSKLLPTKSPLQSLGGPEDAQKVFLHSARASVKWSNSQEQLPPRNLSKALGKLQYQKNVSLLESSPEEWRFQAEDGAEFQPQIFSAGSVNVPVKSISAEDHLPPRHPLQAFEDSEYQQQVYSSFVSAAAKGTSFEGNPSNRSLPRDPASPNKIGKHSQVSEDLIKNVPTHATKFTITPAWPTSTSGDPYSKEEVLENNNQNERCSIMPSSKADVESLFGVRLRRIPSSQKCESENQDHFTKLPSFFLRPISSSIGREPQVRRSASQEFLDTTENLTRRSDFAEKQLRRPKSDILDKSQTAYKIPGKAPDQQADSATSEPAWITMLKQRQKNFSAHVPMKELETKTRVEAKTETTRPKHEGAENQLKEIFTSNVNKQEKMAQMKLPKSTKEEFEDQKIFQVTAMKKETRQSSILQVMPQEPDEPVWFSLAKKKAKAWSHLADIMNK